MYPSWVVRGVHVTKQLGGLMILLVIYMDVISTVHLASHGIHSPEQHAEWRVLEQSRALLSSLLVY